MNLWRISCTIWVAEDAIETKKGNWNLFPNKNKSVNTNSFEKFKNDAKLKIADCFPLH